MESTHAEVAMHMAYAAQQCMDRYEATMKHAIAQKNVFDRHVLKGPGEVTFHRGQLVQVCRSDLDYTFKIEHKLLPKWSQPYRVKDRIQNAYILEQWTEHQWRGSSAPEDSARSHQDRIYSTFMCASREDASSPQSDVPRLDSGAVCTCNCHHCRSQLLP